MEFLPSKILPSEISLNGNFAEHYDKMISKVSFGYIQRILLWNNVSNKKSNFCINYTRPSVTHVDHDKS